MEVVCIKPPGLKSGNVHYQYDKIKPDLEVGKVYSVVFESGFFYYINNRNGGQSSYTKDSFVTLEEWRESRLNQIGI